MKVLLEFSGSHHYWENYEKTDWFCPHCGKQEMWDSTGSGDYYTGTTSYCTACNFSSQLLGGPVLETHPAYLGIIDQLKSGVAREPTTGKGN